MMVSLGLYVRRWQRTLRRLMLDPKLHALAQGAGYILAGFLFSAASLGSYPQPLVLGLVVALSGWPAVLLAVGGVAGYTLFWGAAATQCIAWVALGLIASILLGGKTVTRETPLLMPALAGLIAAGAGLAFQVWLGDTTPVFMYILRIGLSVLSAGLFSIAMNRRDPVVDWAVGGLGVLALAQIMPIPYLGFGYIAAGALTVAGAFPAAALAGLALDLAQITKVPMTAVLCLAYFIRMVPGLPKWALYTAPAAVYMVVMALCGAWDLQPMPGLVIGGFAALFLPGKPGLSHRRGETGFAQVRLEMASSVLSQSEHLLMDIDEHPIDEQALIDRAVDRACGSCPCRKTCKEKPADMPTALLHKPLGNGGDLPLHCRKAGRLLQELRRSQEQLRSIRADRQRQAEYRAAVVQQYGFISDFLRELSDQLSRRTDSIASAYTPKVQIHANRPEGINGDRCLKFAGVLCKYYVVLCDGMGTGPGAAQEGKNAGNLLRRLLSAGFPAEHALRTLNSLCALRSRAGAVTVDLLELHLDTGSAAIYKWGAPTSYLLGNHSVEKLGYAGPPPGLSLTDCQETRHTLTLRRQERLLLVSDGIGQEAGYQCCLKGLSLSTKELAAQILTCAQLGNQDDATIVSVTLEPKS